MNIQLRRLRGVFLLALLLGGSVYADDDGIEEVVVRAHPLSAEGLAQPVSVVDSEELQRSVGQSLGETLNSISGVHSSSFGQAVGRPVIRGLGGPRVKTMEDRIDSLDVSVSSPDHAVTIEPAGAVHRAAIAAAASRAPPPTTPTPTVRHFDAATGGQRRRSGVTGELNDRWGWTEQRTR